MSFIQALSECIHSDFIETKTLPLLEESETAICTEVKLSIAGQKAFIKLKDGGDKFFPYFTNKQHLKVLCEKILFLEENNKKVVFVLTFEMKSYSSGEQFKQLHASTQFAKFIFYTVLRVSPLVANCKPEFRSVIFSLRKPPQPKGTTKSRVRIPYYEDPLTGLKYYIKQAKPIIFDVADFCQ